MNMPYKLSSILYAYGNLYIFKKTPTIVYAPGRVGSMSLIYALRKAGIFSFKVESFVREKRGATDFCKKHIIEANKPAKVITLVRDPIEILCSLYFSKSVRGILPLGYQAIQNEDANGLVSGFKQEALHDRYLPHHLYWYEQEFQPHLDIDIFSHPFDKTQKYSTFTKGRYDILALRIDLEDKKKEDLIKEFIPVNHFKIEHINSKELRVQGELYKSFKTSLKLSYEWIEKIYSAPYTTHFFSPKEIAQFKQKWQELSA